MEDLFWEGMMDAVASARLERWRVVRVRPQIEGNKPDLPHHATLKEVSSAELMNYARFYNYSEIATACNVTRQSVEARVKRIKNEGTTPLTPKKRHTNRIRALVAQGWTINLLADEMGMNPASLKRYYKEYRDKYPHGMDTDT